MEYPTYLIHYGIPGQKWGVRRFQNEDGTYTTEGKLRRTYGEYSSGKKDIEKIKRTHSDYNLNTWGKSKDNNILWVTGPSGSGKSSIARDIAKKNNADVISLDLYTCKTFNGRSATGMSKDFNKFLDKNYPKWDSQFKEAYSVLTRNDRRNIQKVGEWFDTLEDALKKYGSENFGKKKIVAEGIQVLDETLFYNNKEALKNQPVIIMNTSVSNSYISAAVRDKKTKEISLSKERIRQIENLEAYRKSLKKLMSTI